MRRLTAWLRTRRSSQPSPWLGDPLPLQRPAAEDDITALAATTGVLRDADPAIRRGLVLLNAGRLLDQPDRLNDDLSAWEHELTNTGGDPS